MSVETASAGTGARRNRRNLTVTMTVTAMLTALIVVMAFTPIGYLRIGALSLTLIMVPVIIGAVTCGPAVGAFLGLVFGVTSFVQCFMGDVLGTILVGVSIPKTLVVTIVTRVLAGWLCGLICRATQKTGKWRFLIASASGSLLNTVLFLGALALLFWNLSFIDTVLKTVIAIAAGINAPIELAVCAILGTAIGGAVSAAIKRFQK